MNSAIAAESFIPIKHSDTVRKPSGLISFLNINIINCKKGLQGLRLSLKKIKRENNVCQHFYHIFKSSG